MENIELELTKLAAVSKALEADETQRKEWLSKSEAVMNTFLESLPTVKSFNKSSVNQQITSITDEPIDIDENLITLKNELLPKGINAASGGHLGYIPGGGLYSSAIADYIAAVSNAYSGVKYASPGAVAIEYACLDWLKKLFHFPDSAVGNLTSGGSIANLIALTSARDKFGIKNELIPKSVIYLSSQTHHCIHKSIRIIGLEDVVIREIELDDRGRIKSDFLEKSIKKDREEGLNPFLVIASAGTTDTGAVDPLYDIAAITKKEKIWFHVDAAYGGFFILCPETKDLFKGIELADSLVIDPHKGLFLPYGLGAVLIKDKEAVLKSHQYTANYMQDANNEDFLLNPADLSPELTKHFRALRMWLPLRIHGITPFKACLSEKLLLTKYFRQKLADLGFKIGPKPDLSVSYFWYPTGNEKENEFNKKLMEEIHNEGSVFLSSTEIEGKFVIRMAILSFRTKKQTIDRAVKMIKTCLEGVLIRT